MGPPFISSGVYPLIKVLCTDSRYMDTIRLPNLITALLNKETGLKIVTILERVGQFNYQNKLESCTRCLYVTIAGYDCQHCGPFHLCRLDLSRHEPKRDSMFNVCLITFLNIIKDIQNIKV